jgi:hypothetical protein
MDEKQGDTLKEPMMRCGKCNKVFAKSLIDEKAPYCPNEIGPIRKHLFVLSEAEENEHT